MWEKKTSKEKETISNSSLYFGFLLNVFKALDEDKHRTNLFVCVSQPRSIKPEARSEPVKEHCGLYTNGLNIIAAVCIRDSTKKAKSH